MPSFRLSSRYGVFVASMIVLGGCAGTPLNPPSGTIGGITAAKSKVVLRQQQLVRMRGNVDYVCPAGDYRPAYEDETGVYYEAPSKIIMKENFLGLKLPGKPMEGGIFLERSNPKQAKIYGVIPRDQGGEIQRMMKGGRPAKPIDPKEPFAFELTKA